MNGQIDPQAEMTMGIVHFEPNQSNVLHIHPNSAEFLHMLSGTAEHLIDGKWVTLKAGDTLRIPKGVPHQARTKDQGYEALIVYDTPTRVMVPVKEAKPAGPAPAPVSGGLDHVINEEPVPIGFHFARECVPLRRGHVFRPLRGVTIGHEHPAPGLPKELFQEGETACSSPSLPRSCG